MNRRHERRASRPHDFDIDKQPERHDRVIDEDLPEVDLEVAPADARTTEPADPLAAAPALTPAGDDPLAGFSDSARRRYDLEVSSYAADLRRQSLARKRSHGGDSVSGRDVVSAAHFLRSYRYHRIFKYLGAVGGVLFGLGAQSLGSMVEKGVYTTGGVLWGAGTTVAGVAVVVWYANRDR